MTAHSTRIAEAAPRYTPPDTLADPALRAFFRLAEHWKLRAADQRKLLGDPPERISYLLGIWKSLQILFPDPAQADAWLHKPNAAPLFGGHSALERMLSGNVADLYVVRQYLDAQRG